MPTPDVSPLSNIIRVYSSPIKPSYNITVTRECRPVTGLTLIRMLKAPDLACPTLPRPCLTPSNRTPATRV